MTEREPPPGYISIDDAAREVALARWDEVEQVIRFYRYRAVVPEVIAMESLVAYAADRQMAINQMADRPIEGEIDGTTTE